MRSGFLSLLEAFILGMVQGITEFLPISSTAHLVIVQRLFNLDIPGLAFEVFLHLASLLAVMIFYWRDLVKLIKEFFLYIVRRQPDHRTSFFFSIYILIATAITGVLGVIIEKKFNTDIKSMTVIAIALAVTGIALVLIEKVVAYGNRKDSEMTWLDAVIIGLGQTLAVLPGISRSGSTLVVALWRGLDKEVAVRYTFLLSIPVILGSGLLMVPNLATTGLDISIPSLLVSFVVSFVFALLGIKWLIEFLNRSKLIYFAYYCFGLSALVLIFLR